MSEVKIKPKKKKRKIIIIVVSVLVALIAVFIAAIIIYDHVGYRPFWDILKEENVEKITVQYAALDEIELKKGTTDYYKALYIIQDLRIYLPRLDYEPIYGYSDAGFHFYMKDGTKHEVWLITTTRKNNRDYCYVGIDGKTFNVNYYWRYSEMERFLKPYIKKSIEKNKKSR